MCTAHTNTTLAIEVFGPTGGPALASVTGVALAPGETATVVTQALQDLPGATDLLTGAFRGSARISTIAGGKVSCSAFVAGTLTNTSGFSLPVVKAKGQKGQ